jgi:hypothetical protein
MESTSDIRQLILLMIAVIVPFFLLRTKRTRLLLGWVCMTMTIQIFDTAIITNLPPGRIVGLIYLPQAFIQLRDWLRLTPARAWLVNYGYLVILGLAFGFLWPWQDITMSRPFNLTAPGRTVVFLVRTLSDISLTIFVASEIRKSVSLLYIGRALALGSTMSGLAGLIQFATKLDPYYLITGMGEQILEIDRARGLAGEPRGLGLICAYGVMVLLLGQQKLFKTWLPMLVINIAGLLVTYSASSMFLFVAGVIAAWLFFSNWVRAIMVGAIALTSAILLGASIYLPAQFQAGVETLQLRLDPSYKLAGIAPGTFGQEIAYRLDVFDSSALLFLLDEPIYALMGTGPGLVSLPASYHVPPGLYSLIWTPEVGINSLPFHGLLLEVSNSGVLGLACWLFQVIACLGALRFLTRQRLQREVQQQWEFGYAIFLIGAVFYIVQVSSSPIWNLFLGIGWAAAMLVEEHKQQASLLPSNQRGFERPPFQPLPAYPSIESH